MSSIDQVVSHGVCVGCGGCSAATDGRIPVVLTTRGQYEADLSTATARDKEIGSRVCPFTAESKNEDEIADGLFPSLPTDTRTGRHLSMFAGRISDDEEITKSSSGGLTTWLLVELLKRGAVDGVIHVGDTSSPMFGYVVSSTVEDLLGGRKSKYYPASFAETLRSIKGDGRKYAFVGVPCAVRSARLVCEEDAELGAQLRYLIGIVCGHLKSTAYAESFAWQLGVAPDDISYVDFRIKDPALTSRQYAFGVKSRVDAQWREAQTLSLVGGSWGHAVFQLDACNYCDDVFAETADVVIGDAWLSKFEVDWRGTNVVVTRNAELDSILQEARGSGAFTSEALDVESVARTQAGNFRHRRDGLAVRLADDQRDGVWHPPKRVAAGRSHVSPERVDLIRMRRSLSKVSHEAFARAKEANDLNVYLEAITPVIDKYQSRTKMPLTTRVRNKLHREFWRSASRAKAVVGGGARGRPAAVSVVLTGVSGNLGDAVIRRRVLQWCRGLGEIHAYVGRATPGWTDQLQLQHGERVYTIDERSAWLRQLVLGRARPVLVLDPGEVPLSREHLRPEFFYLMIIGLIRARGGYVFRPPRAVGHCSPVVERLNRSSSRLSDVALWRTEASFRRMRVGRLAPDTAFAEPFRPGPPEAERRHVLVSMRAERPFPPAQWFDGIRDFADRNGLTIVTMSQVDKDEPRNAAIADRFGGNAFHVAWDGRTDLEQELAIRERYSTSRVVISDRLHALILAAQEGAQPAEVAAQPRKKVAQHFDTIGMKGVSLDVARSSRDDVVEFLNAQCLRGAELRSQMASAREALQDEVEGFRRSVRQLGRR